MKRNIAFVVGLTAPLALQAFTPFSVTSYFSISDSPLAAGPGEMRVIETFEGQPAGQLNHPAFTTRALLNDTILHVGVPGPNTDSVDADDGMVDGSGQGGRSLSEGSNSAAGNAGFEVIFNVPHLGYLPVQVGVVWTDGDDTARPVSVDFYDGMGAFLGNIASGPLGDGAFTGGGAEDRFFGASHAGGIGSFVIRQPGSDNNMEIDHVQWVVAVPEPSTAILTIGFTTIAVMFRRRRCRTVRVRS